MARSDRCDSCGAEASHIVLIGETSSLLFCTHHLRKHGKKLHDSGFEIVSLNPEPVIEAPLPR